MAIHVGREQTGSASALLIKQQGSSGNDAHRPETACRPRRIARAPGEAECVHPSENAPLTDDGQSVIDAVSDIPQTAYRQRHRLKLNLVG
jgi:hypothetical protein